MKTQLSYFEDTYKCYDRAMIIASNKEETGHYIVLDKTIYYPQGGGQPSDLGTIEVGNVIIPIKKVKSIDNEVRHYTDQDYSHLVGQACKCVIDQELRLLHAKLHTSGHLISNVIESLYSGWNAVKGNHFSGQCYVEFASKNGSLDEISIKLANEEIKKLIEKDYLIRKEQVSGDRLKELCPNIPYKLPGDQPIRIVRIGGFPFQPCGGTHVRSLKELKGLEITKCRIKNNLMKIYYDLI